MQLVRSATKYITFVTPHVILWEPLKDAILDAKNRKVDVVFFVRKGANRRRPQDLKWLNKNFKVHEVPHLHAKVYLNETTVLVSSMNITEPSIRGKKDFAMVVRRQDDATVFRDYVSGLIPKFATTQSSHSIGNHVSGLIATATVTKTSHSIEPQTSETGTCIRCGKKMRFNKNHPLCDDCFGEWSINKNKNHHEKYCHSCGKSAETFDKPITYRIPRCRPCWNQSR